MRWIWSKLRLGILAVIPVFLIALVINWIVGGINAASLPLLENRTLNFCLNAAMWFTALCVLGWLVSMRWCRSLVLKLCARIPILSSISSTLLSHDYIERMKNDELGMMPEVLICLDSKDDWALGLVTNRMRLPENLRNILSSSVDWCIVLAPLTPPLSVTSQMRLRRESELIYTGRSGKDGTLTVATFGMNCKLDPKKFAIKKPSR